LGTDLTAMVVDDLAANGFVPTNLSNILDVDTLDREIVKRLMKGLYRAAKEARVAVTGGEIAELGNRIQGFGERMHFNWCATAIGYLPVKLPAIDGRRIAKGDAIVALHCDGFRSNGYSLLREILDARFGASWHLEHFSAQKTWGQIALYPSQIFAPLVVKLRQSAISIKGIAHITGGGLIDNFRRVLKASGLGANLETLPSPPSFMIDVQKLGSLSDAEAYRYWNMGIGMLLVLPPSEVGKMLAIQRKHFKKIQCSVVGKVTGDPFIRITSQGASPTQITAPLNPKTKLPRLTQDHAQSD
jgi:phosphoribosylformylglycinamidine cyclo-ligase